MSAPAKTQALEALVAISPPATWSRLAFRGGGRVRTCVRSPVSLARFEADAGTTNRGNIRLECNACCGVERQTAAIRVAAS